VLLTLFSRLHRRTDPRGNTSKSRRRCSVAGKVSQSQGFWAIRLFGLSKLGLCGAAVVYPAFLLSGLSEGVGFSLDVQATWRVSVMLAT
jgi:hypothetical protein